MEREVIGTILSINRGMPVPVRDGKREVTTGIFKTAANGPVRLGLEGIPGDGQADLVNHGGPDKAVCVYSADHADFWRAKWDKPVEAGAFGENFTIAGGPETAVFIGDVCRVGEALVQVTQARLPCFKLGLRHGIPSLPLDVQTTGYTGFYLRVLEEGIVRTGDELLRIRRHPAEMTVREGARIMLEARNDLEAARRLLAVPELAASWREMLEARIAKLEASGGGAET